MKYILNVFFAAFMMACTSGESSEQTEESAESTDSPATDTEMVDQPESEGFNTIEELATSLVSSLKSHDFESYKSHVMTESIELNSANQIADETKREEFKKEFGFGLKHEREFFDELIAHFENNNIDISNAKMDELEFVPFKANKFDPLKLYEVLLPIEADYEMLIDFTVIEVDGKYFLTSELGI